MQTVAIKLQKYPRNSWRQGVKASRNNLHYAIRYNQVAGTVYRNIICSVYSLNPPKTKWETQKIVKCNKAKILWGQGFCIQSKQILGNKPNIVVIDKNQEPTLVIDIAISSDRSVRKKEYKKLEKYQELKEKLKKMWKIKAKVFRSIANWNYDPQNKKVASADSRKNIRDL